MRYAFLCYDSESIVCAWTKEQDAAVIARHQAAQQPHIESGRLTKSLRLMPTTAAITVRSGDEPLVIDGPFAETKEQLLGLWLSDFDTLDEALDFARQLSAHKNHGAVEVRPVMVDYPIPEHAMKARA